MTEATEDAREVLIDGPGGDHDDVQQGSGEGALSSAVDVAEAWLAQLSDQILGPRFGRAGPLARPLGRGWMRARLGPRSSGG